MRKPKATQLVSEGERRIALLLPLPVQCSVSLALILSALLPSLTCNKNYFVMLKLSDFENKLCTMTFIFVHKEASNGKVNNVNECIDLRSNLFISVWTS